MQLEEYRAKRDFSKTSEPEIDQNPDNPGSSWFVIQEHHASRLHYDFRLEFEGVLKSWAVPKGVPLETGVRRLAVETEDHPVSYLTFEGVIPEGQYGAGTVTVWDQGSFDTIAASDNKIEINLYGSKVTGGYALIRTGGTSWLLLKKKPLASAGQNT